MNGGRAVTLTFLALMALAASWASPALAQTRPPPRPVPAAPAPVPVAGKVNIELMVVHASNAYDRVDPALQPVLQPLRFVSYKGFKLLSKDDSDVAVGAETTFPVVGGRRVQVDVVDRDSVNAKIRIRMYNDKKLLLDTTVSIHRDKSFMVAGPEHEGGMLVLPITARY
jgi:hypothetical protein